MTPAQFWTAVPYAIVIGLAGLCGVLTIFAVHGLLETWTKTGRAVFPPVPPDNVVDIADRRQQLDRMTICQPESLEIKNFRTMQRAEHFEWPVETAVNERVH